MFRVIPLAAQISVLERMIMKHEQANKKRPQIAFEREELAVLKSLILDCRAQLPGANAAALRDLEERLKRVSAARLPDGGFDPGRSRDLVHHIMAHWPTLRAALLAHETRVE